MSCLNMVLLVGEVNCVERSSREYLDGMTMRSAVGAHAIEPEG